MVEGGEVVCKPGRGDGSAGSCSVTMRKKKLNVCTLMAGIRGEDVMWGDLRGY